MRGFGRQCRGQGTIFVKLGRETERPLFARGHPMAAWTAQAREHLHQDSTWSQAQRGRLLRELEATCDAHRHIIKQSQRLTQGKKLAPCKIVNACDPTIAPSSRVRATTPPSLAAKSVSCRSPLPALSLPTRCLRAIPVT
jgi:hypothetical protein